MTPVILLSEGYLGNGSEPWHIPSMADLPDIKPRFAKASEGAFRPYVRDAETFAREWAIPGKAGLEHRVGGLEKNHDGVLSIDPANHGLMVAERAEKVARVADELPLLEVEGPASGKLLVVGWGGTYGHISSAVEELRAEGIDLSQAHFSSIRPLPRNTEEVFKGFERILVVELNSGQFASWLRSNLPGHEYLQFNKVEGRAFSVNEIKEEIRRIV